MSDSILVSMMPLTAIRAVRPTLKGCATAMASPLVIAVFWPLLGDARGNDANGAATDQPMAEPVAISAVSAGVRVNTAAILSCVVYSSSSSIAAAVRSRSLVWGWALSARREHTQEFATGLQVDASPHLIKICYCASERRTWVAFTAVDIRISKIITIHNTPISCID